MFDAYRRPAWHAHYFEQESIKENLRILAAAHTDPYVLEQAYAQDEENEPMIDPTGDPLDDDEEECCLFCGPQFFHDNPICPKYDPRYDGENCAYCGRYRAYDQLSSDFTPDTHFTSESTTWFCTDEDDCRAHTEPAEASDVTGWDQHGPSYE